MFSLTSLAMEITNTQPQSPHHRAEIAERLIQKDSV